MSSFRRLLEGINDTSVSMQRENDESRGKKIQKYAGSMTIGAATGSAKGALAGYGVQKLRHRARDEVIGELERERLRPTKGGNPIAEKIRTKYAIPDLQKTIRNRIPDKLNMKTIGKGAAIGAIGGAVASIPMHYAWEKFRKNPRVRKYYRGKAEEYFGGD
jgi:hypothetical protein